jgi:hypothetical protein
MEVYPELPPSILFSLFVGLTLEYTSVPYWQQPSAMADPTEVELLRARDMVLYGNADGPTFAFLVE